MAVFNTLLAVSRAAATVETPKAHPCAVALAPSGAIQIRALHDLYKTSDLWPWGHPVTDLEELPWSEWDVRPCLDCKKVERAHKASLATALRVKASLAAVAKL